MAINQVPQANQTLATTQNPILNNFINIDAQYGIDHVPFNTGGAGWHNTITFVSQGVAPVPTGSNLVMYNALNATATAQALFVSNAAGPAIDFTSSIRLSPGYFRLPSGILVKWGRTGNITGTGTFAMDLGMPVFITNPPFLVLFTLLTSNGPAAAPYWIPGTTTTTNIGFTISNTFTGANTTASLTWCALGIG